MVNIPCFPKSKKLAVNDKDEIESFNRRFLPYSDYNFTSLYCYNVSNNVEVSWLNENLVVLFQGYMSDEMYYSFLGETKVEETATELLKHSVCNGLKNELRLITEHTIKHINNPSNLSIYEDLDNHDYILSTDLLSTYKGNELRNKRNLSNRFLKKYLNHEVQILNLNNRVIKDKILEVFNIWASKKELGLENTKTEYLALNRFIEISEYVNVVCVGLFIDDNMIGFIISELLTNNYAVIHFDKGDLSFEGITSYLRQVSAQILNKNGYDYINYEQDMGISGLRKAKHQLKPVSFLKKYVITQK